jgi:hypothetical protein
MTTRPDPIDVLDTLAHEAGLGAADTDVKLTPEEQQDARRLIAFARSELAKQARADVVDIAPVVRPVRPSILAMSRDALLTRLRDLQIMQRPARLAVSHRHFAGNVSDNDLRTLLEDLEANLDRAGDDP